MSTKVGAGQTPIGYKAVPDEGRGCDGCFFWQAGKCKNSSSISCRLRKDQRDVIFAKQDDGINTAEVSQATQEDRRMTAEGAMKFDLGKPRMELLERYAMEQTALVLNFGAVKYAPWNWTKGIAYSRLLGAALRHIFAFASGEDNDKESGLPHLAHAMCCIMFLLGMTQRHPELDDRNKVSAE